jgi:hypothetical protein
VHLAVRNLAAVAVDRVVEVEGDRLGPQVVGEVRARDQGLEPSQRITPKQRVDRGDRLDDAGLNGGAHSGCDQTCSSAACNVASPARWA